jgi:HK97 family phage portal protein
MNLRNRIASWLLRGIHPRDPALAQWLGSAMTASGVSVTADNAISVAAVYSCIRVLSETLAGLPLIVYRRKPGGGKERATDHWLYQLLHVAPNGWMTSFAWREMGMAHLCLRGASYSRIVGDARGKRQLIPIHPDRMRPVLLDSGRLAYEMQNQNGGFTTLLQEEVLRIPFMTLDGVRPVTPIQSQRETIGASLASQDYGARFWANDARPTGGWIEMEGDFKDEVSGNKFRDKWQAAMTGENRHKTPFLPKGMKYHPLSLTMEDAQFLDTRKYQRSEIAGLFRVPPHMIGDLERATFSNVEQQSIDFVVYTMQPWLSRWEQELSRGLLSESEQEEYFVEFLVDGLLRGDATARANYFRTAVLTGWMNRNEVREIENMNRADGLDEYLTPLNMTPADLLAETIKGKIQ